LKVLVTGAGGFIGSILLKVLQQSGHVGPQRIGAVAALDHQLPDTPASVRRMEGDLHAPVVRKQIEAFAPDVCFHLAAVPGGAAEADPALSRRVNLDATLDLFETLATSRAAASLAPTVVVYASTIAVYGSPLPAPVTPLTPTRPPMVYGAHKLACEIILADFTRRGLLDGRSLRLPGIVARPRAPSGLVSAFMSNLMHALAAGEPFTCPVGPEATAWWMSARRCAQNLMHAAVMNPAGDAARAWPLPVLHLSIGEVIRTLSAVYAVDGGRLVTHAPQPSVEAVFGRYPVLDDRASRSLGLRDDGTAEDLVRRALEADFIDAEGDRDRR
jgi:nucleoside-diphosphate-sugar epimerase